MYVKLYSFILLKYYKTSSLWKQVYWAALFAGRNLGGRERVFLHLFLNYGSGTTNTYIYLSHRREHFGLKSVTFIRSCLHCKVLSGALLLASSFWHCYLGWARLGCLCKCLMSSFWKTTLLKKNGYVLQCPLFCWLANQLVGYIGRLLNMHLVVWNMIKMPHDKAESQHIMGWQ